MSHGHELLRLLSDGRFYSGERLGDSLGISRAGVWKQLRGLRARGVDIHSVPGRGYRLAEPLELLDADAVVAGLPKATRRRLGPVEVHYEIDSTNSEWLRRAAGLPAGAVCMAETQRAGRGRMNRRWVSACGRSLCLSLLWRFGRGPDALGGLGLVVGLAVLRAVDDLGIEGAGLKWPNDVLWRDAKLAGSLIELSGESGGAACAVIGVGANVDLPRASGRDIDQPWADLATARGGKVSRNRFAGRLIHRLIEALACFERDGLGAFLDEWRGRDRLCGREVSVHTLAGVETGIARGVDAGGALLVESGGQVRRYLAGDVSVRTGPQPP
jgi:BirA family biotin operon repressor/biotin-[acetyl-CoA-carboxylase] ligase